MLTAVFIIGRSPQLAIPSRDEAASSPRDDMHTALATNR
jgi:hypothetical protein